MENSQLRLIYQQTIADISQHPQKLKAFLKQNSYLHQMPFEEIVQIHGQNSNATILKTWDEWKELATVPLKGQTAIQSLKTFNDRYSKRNSYYDITQLVHRNVNIKTTTISPEQLDTFLFLNHSEFYHQSEPLSNYLNYLKKYSEETLNDFKHLNQNEKELVPLVAHYNVLRTLNVADKTLLPQINNEVYEAFSKENIRFQNVVKIGNNLSTSQLDIILPLKERLEFEAQRLCEEKYSNDAVISKDEQVQVKSPSVTEATIKEPLNNQKRVANREEYQEMLEFGYSHLHDSYMHYQNLKLKGQNVSGAYDTFDFKTVAGDVQLGFNYIGREQGTDDDSKVVFWVSTDIEAYSTAPMSTPIRSRVFRTFEASSQALNFANTPSKQTESIKELSDEVLEDISHRSDSFLDERGLLEKIKSDFNLNEDYLIHESDNEFILQKVSFGGVLTEKIVSIDSGEIEISDVADSITGLKTFTAQVEAIITQFHSEALVQTDSSNKDLSLLSDYSLQEELVENYAKRVDVENNSNTSQAITQWSALREEEIRRNALKKGVSVSLIDKLEESETEAERSQNNQPIVGESETLVEPTSNVSLEDFEFPTALSDFYPQTPTEKVNANLQAIKLVKEIELENRGATADEQQTLAKYVGWGGLANEFFDENRLKFATQRNELQSLVSKQEYQAMRESSLTAFYTDPMIIRKMYQSLEEKGFKGGRILDPAMGTGNFFSALPRHLRENSELYGVELDPITGTIAKLLHPHANIKIQGFETTNFNPESFDIIVGNVPFGNFTINDSRFERSYQIHDYFFKNALRLVRKGGLVSFITSTGTMDKRNQTFRKELGRDSALISAIRLPNNAFKAIAGTDVSSDILTLQKGQSQSVGEWLSTSDVYDNDGQIIEGVQSNSLFSYEISPVVLGSYQVKNFNGKTLSVLEKPQTLLVDEIDKAFAFEERSSLISAKSFYAETSGDLSPSVETLLDVNSTTSTLPEEVKNLSPQSHLIYNDKIYFNDSEEGIIEKNEAWYKAGYKPLLDENDKPRYDQKGRPKMGNTRGNFDNKTLARLKGMIKISQRVEAIVKYQIENPITEAEDVQFEYLLKSLNETYDAFVNDKKLSLKNGNTLNNPKNSKIFEDDVNLYRLLSIENEIKDESGSVQYIKGDFFFKKTISPAIELPQIDDAKAGLDLSINLYGSVNIDFIAEQLSSTPEAVISDLGASIYLNPQTERYETSSEYLSGNLTHKLKALELKKESGTPFEPYEKNKSALEKALPERLSLEEIDFRIGTRWIPLNVYNSFLKKTLNNGYRTSMEVEYNSVSSTYRVTNPTYNNRVQSYQLSQFYKSLQIPGHSSHHNPIHLFEDLLNLKNTRVMDRVQAEDGKEKSVLNPDLTIVARSHQEALQSEFKSFIKSDERLVQELETIYNETFNSTVVRTFDGNNLTFDHLSPNITPRPHQKDAVSRIIQEKRALLDHVVGSGKTISMILAGRKLKQMGAIKKPAYIVPKAVLTQFASEALRTYPDLNIIVPNERDFSVSNRKKFMAKIQTGDYDAVFLSTEQFGKIPITKEREEAIIQAEIDEIISVKNRAKDENQSRPTIKQLIRLEKGAKERLEKLQTQKDETSINFEATGIDFLFVDEAHLFKNLSFQTNITDVKGINTTGSQRSSDMLGKVRYLQEIHQGGGVVFATGTPISNSMAEMYTMMKYLMPELLAQENISNFDEWASTFGEIETRMEVDQTGQKWKSVSRFAKFHNVTELLNLFGQVADTQTQEMLDLPVPQIANDGKPFVHATEMTEAQSAYMEQLIYRSENMPADPTIDNMLKLTTDARLMASDMRLIDDSLYRQDDSLKCQQVAETVYEIWQKTSDTRASQLIFSDIGTPKGKNTEENTKPKFSVYGEIRERLETMGIPQNKIAFIHDYVTDKQRDILFENVRKGDIRVLFASTQKGGTGVNIQHNLYAIHHFDAPWKPSDIEQRNGRIVRQGNINPFVEIHHYVTTGTFDTSMWQRQEQKLTYINQIRTRKSKSRTVDDMDELVLNASEIKAIATKNPFIKEKMDLENNLTKLNILRNSFYANQRRDKQELQRLEEVLPGTERYYERAIVDSTLASHFQKMEADDFSLTLEGHLFTDKTKAGDYLSQKAYHATETKTLGKYGGFDLVVKPNLNPDITAEPTLYLVGENSYPIKLNPSSGAGSMVRIDNIIKGTIAHKADNQKEQIKGMKNQIEQLKAKANLVFEKDDEFQETTQRLAQVNAEIELGVSKTPEPTENKSLKAIEPLKVEVEFEM